jgi:hypothetical protein
LDGSNEGGYNSGAEYELDKEMLKLEVSRLVGALMTTQDYSMLRAFKCASVSMTDKFICVETYSGRGLMGRDSDGVCDFHHLNVSCHVLGSSLRVALAASRWLSMDEYAMYFDHAKLKRVDEAWLDQVSRLFDYRNRKSVFQNMSKCSVDGEDGAVVVSPKVHVKLEGWSGERIDTSEKVTLDATSSDDIIGEGVRLALSRCR